MFLLYNSVINKDIFKMDPNVYKAVIEQSPRSVIITDSFGKICYVNRRFQEFMKYSPEDVCGKPPRLFNRGHFDDAEYDEMWRLLKSGESWSGEVKNRKKSGEFFWEQVLVSPLLNSSGEITNYIITLEDITEKRRLLAEMEEAKDRALEGERLKTAFLNNISHEIRTPINSIVGFSALLKDPSVPIERHPEFIDMITNSSKQLLSTINDIVSIASIESGNEKLYIREFKINGMMERLYTQYKGVAQERGLNFKMELFFPDDDVICADEVKISVVLSNMLSNAFKFTKRGSVIFGYTLKNGRMLFYVEDTGIGIERSLQKDVFKIFHQLDYSVSRAFGGTGLGLAVCKAYVNIMNGEIWFNTVPGSGSTFYFDIPYRQGMKDTRQEVKDLIIGLESTKVILVAEDDTNSYLLIEEYLKDTGYLLIRADNGLEAVNICKTLKVDLILMDIKMPAMSGLEAVQRIRDFMPDVPIIAQTGKTDEGDINSLLQAGCDDYVLKPIVKADLVDIVGRFV